MDINQKGVLYTETCEVTNNGQVGDTTLRLYGFVDEESNMTRFKNSRSNLSIISSEAPEDSCRLMLGLGPTPTTYAGNYYEFRFNKSKSSSSPVIQQGILSESKSILQLGLPRATESDISVPKCSPSILTDMNMPECHLQNEVFEDSRLLFPVVDEGSTSAKKSGSCMPSFIADPNVNSGKTWLPSQEVLDVRTESDCLYPHMSPETSVATEYSTGIVFEPVAAVTSLDHRINNPKKCKFGGCTKGARGSSGFCVGHGGGQRCQKLGCSKGAESRTAYCKSHGGGRRCDQLGCTKSAEGKTDYCIAHGGGRRCGFEGGCTKAARGRSGLCIKHGGGKRCTVEGCTRSAEGQAGLCISHGGGRRCKYEGCTKGAQGSTMFCKAHGGGKRCVFVGCTKGAEGSTPFCKAHGGGKRCLYDGGGICPKSVHGGTSFCVAHGGGKRCVVAGCTKSARGRTDYCVRHGGGKRCRFENCGKSAQGSTDFCKAHGGGKRCDWGDSKCAKFARGKSGLCAAHTTMVQERGTNNRGGVFGPGLFHGLFSAASTVESTFDNNYSSSGVSAFSDSVDSHSLEYPAKQRRLISAQVLTLSMKSQKPSESGLLGTENQVGGTSGCGDNGMIGGGPRRSLDSLIPEGRVHDGGLMSLFGGNLSNAIDGI